MDSDGNLYFAAFDFFNQRLKFFYLVIDITTYSMLTLFTEALRFL